MAKNLKIDTYTKFILTVIAVCLVWISIRDIDFLPKAYASDQDELVDVRIRAMEMTQGESWDPIFLDLPDDFSVEVVNRAAIPVNIKNELLPVDVKRVAVKKVLSIDEIKKHPDSKK